MVNAFGADSDWLRNIEAKPGEEVTVDRRQGHSQSTQRILSADVELRG